MEEKAAVLIAVNEVPATPMGGQPRTYKRTLLTSENLEIEQIEIARPGVVQQASGAEEVMTLYYIVGGEATLRQEKEDMRVSVGCLLVVSRGTPRESELLVKSEGLTLLAIRPRLRHRGCKDSSDGPAEGLLRVVNPAEVPPYEPAGHVGTVNRRLFLDERVEVIEGRIEAGGGAEEHLHEDLEQVLYVLEGAQEPLLIYYPRGTPHGTSEGVSQPLKLLVIYSPPLREAAARR